MLVVLAWLLTPTETRGFADTILRRAMAQVVVSNDMVSSGFPLSASVDAALMQG